MLTDVAFSSLLIAFSSLLVVMLLLVAATSPFMVVSTAGKG